MTKQLDSDLQGEVRSTTVRDGLYSHYSIISVVSSQDSTVLYVPYSRFDIRSSPALYCTVL